MFESATLKLTLIYVSVVVLICLFFSATVYTIAAREIDQGFRRQETFLTNRPGNRGIDPSLLIELRETAEVRLEESKDVLQTRLIVSNLIIISASAIASFTFAKRTLAPIEAAHLEQIRFTADASHELRSPLTAMRTEVDVALREPKLSKADAVKQLGSLQEELGRMTTLSNNLLALAAHQESSSLNFKVVQIKPIIERSIERNILSAKQKNITFSTSFEEGLVFVEPSQIEEVISVILENAIKYSGKKTTVRIESIVVKKHVQVTITDQGIGFNQDESPKLFERFYRADNSRSQQHVKGNGLGLAIAAAIIDAHPNAEIRASSQGQNLGSTFTVMLPLAK